MSGKFCRSAHMLCPSNLTDYLRTKCLKALLLKIIAHKQKSLLTLYRSKLNRSKLDYASFIYGSARKSYISKLEPITISLGAFITSPTTSLQILSQVSE